MDRLRLLLARLRGLFGKSAADRQLDDEIALHLELETRKNIELGLSPAEAGRRARIAFGAIEAMKEDHRDRRGIRWIDGLTRDLRQAGRSLRRDPGLAVATTATLALGIGASTAIFSALDAVVLRPLPFASPERLMMIGEDNAEFGWKQADAAPANFLDWREQTTAFAGMAGYLDFPGRTTLTGSGEPQLLNAATVTGNFFAVFGARPTIGRAFDDRETWNTGVPVAVISLRLWRSLFHADTAISGRTVVLDGRRVAIVGVAPPAFAFPFDSTDIWMPTAWNPDDRGKTWFRRAHFVKVVGRIRPGVPPAIANQQLQAVVTRLQHDYPATNKTMGATITTLQAFLARDIRTPLLVLMSAASALLLIACANVGNLLLVRALGRQHEAALRIALGAGRARIARESMIFSLVLSALGGIAGYAVARAGTKAVLALRPAGLLPASAIGVDGRILVFMLIITAISAAMFGLGPALWTGRRDPAAALKQGSRAGGAGRSVQRAVNLMIVAEVALAATLVVGAGLLVRSFASLTRVQLGLDPAGVLAVGLDLPAARYETDAKVARFYDELERRTRPLPGVVSAAAVSNPPLTAFSWSSQFAIDGRPLFSGGNDVVHREITPDYFTVMHVPLLRGRAFSAQDDANAPPVVLINDVIARRYFGGEDPIGKRVTFDRVPDSTSHWRTIIGVVGTEHQAGPDIEPRAEFFAPLAQEGGRNAMTLMVRTSVDPASVAPAIRRMIAELDPELAILSVQTMGQIRDHSLAARRFLMTLLLVFAGSGLLLSAVGVYGVMAQGTTSRRREMGIRIALGARPPRLQWMVVRNGLRLALVGVGLGLGAAVLGARLMTAMLFGVHPVDPASFAGAAVVLLSVASVATWIPAARASRVDPVESLRAE